ncbi:MULTISPECIES: hypothetical protein [unclassified Luteimonas]
MSDFLRLLAPRHADALRPAAPLRALAAPIAPMADMQASTGEPEAPGIAAPRLDTAKSRTAGMQVEHPRADALPHGTRGRIAATDSAPIIPGVARHPAVDAMPLESPALPRNDKAGAQDALALRSVAPAIQPAPHDHSTIGPPPAQRARAAPPAPLPRSMPEQLAAPLSATTVALLAPAMAPAAPPAIHISIDRIEVRAPAQPAKQPPPRPRVVPEPQNLHDYLRRKPSP